MLWSILELQIYHILFSNKKSCQVAIIYGEALLLNSTIMFTLSFATLSVHLIKFTYADTATKQRLYGIRDSLESKSQGQVNKDLLKR